MSDCCEGVPIGGGDEDGPIMEHSPDCPDLEPENPADHADCSVCDRGTCDHRCERVLAP